MKKSKKLLSVLLAVLMLLSSVSVMASAYGDYNNLGAEVYDSNDMPRGALLTVEQRASYVMDLLDGVLKSANLVNTRIPVLGININLTSYDGIIDTLCQNSVANLIGGFGDLADLKFSCVYTPGLFTGTRHANGRAQDGDAKSLGILLQLLSENKGLISRVLAKGSLSLGSLASSFADLSSVNNVLADLPDMLGGLIYGLGARQLTNGIGDDPEWPNTPAWETLEEKPTVDELVKKLVLKLLTEPRHTTNITAPEQNTLGSQALTEEVGDVTYYYCYGVDDDGNLITTPPEGEENPEKIYLSHWDENSALLEDFDPSLVDFTGKSVYDLVEDLIPWAYDTYGAHNLDAQFRATLMQACGAVNRAEDDPEIQEQLKAKVDEYKAIQDEGDRQALSKKFAEDEGFAGDYNFMYISLGEAKSINEKPDNLYYVVEWGGSYEYYKVDFSDVNGFFALGNWEYQIGSWDEVCTNRADNASILAKLNDILGNIAKTAVPTADWTMGDNSNLINNIVKIVKQFVKADPTVVFGAEGLPENFETMTAEEIVVLAGKMLMDDLLKALVLPENVTSIEELIVYGVREFTDEILQEYGEGWDEKIAAAAALSGSAKEDAFLDIALNMGTTIGAYYLKNIAGYGTYRTSDTSQETSLTYEFRDVPMGPSHEWKEILNGIVDWVINLWVPRLTSHIVTENQEVFNGNDGLAKLSALFSAMFPSLAKVIGCSGETYALDLDVVYAKLRSVLNGDFTPLLTALERKADGTAANYTVSKAIITIVKELFGGLGLETANSWTATYSANGQDYVGLSTFLDNAANSATPIQSLLGAYGGDPGSKELANLAGGLIGCLGETRDIWAYDAIAILATFTLMGSLSYDGVWYEGMDAYTGSESYTVDFTVGLDTSGIPQAFNDKGYLSGTTTVDGNYSAEVTRAEILDNNGSQVPGSASTYNQALQPGAEVQLSTQLPNAPSDVSLYTVVVYYKVTTPSGEQMNDGEELALKKTVIVTSQKNDSLTPNIEQFTDTKEANYNPLIGSKKNFKLDFSLDYGATNTYISDRQTLKEAESTLLHLTENSVETSNTDLHHDKTVIYINGYGYNVTDPDTGKIKVSQSEDGSGDPTDLTQFFTVTTQEGKDGEVKTLSGDELQNLWFKWNINGTSINQDGHVNETREEPMWVVDTSASRSDYTADFTTYKIVVKPTLAYNHVTFDGIGRGSKNDQTTTIDLTSYINIYNSYGLDEILGAALGAAYTRDQFISGTRADAAWNAYQTALTQAMNVRYGKWVGETFAADHTNEEGVSTFKVASEALQKAMNALSAYHIDDEEEQTKIIEPSNPESDLYAAYTALQTEYDKGYRTPNYALYRWAKYSDTRTALSDLINAATPPSGVANKTLTGVDLDNAGIDGVIASIEDPKISSLVQGLVVEPTEEQTKAAAAARENFVMPDYDVQQVANQVSAMQTYESRLLAKYDNAELAGLHHYLNKAITDFGSESPDAYTAQSYADYKAALDHAKEVDANGTAQPSVLHAARYDFLVAYKALVPTEEAVDLTDLKASMEKARAILANPDGYKLSAAAADNGFEDMDAALKDLILKAGYKTEYAETPYFIGGEYTGEYALSQEGYLTGANKENWVAEIVARVDEAVANFEATAKPDIFAKEDGDDDTTSGQDHNGVVDREHHDGEYAGYLYGITPGESVEEVFRATGGTLEYVANDKGVTNGTGAIVQVMNDKEVVAKYVVIIFGDVNGDGAVDAEDRLLLTQDIGGASELSGAFDFAGNVNGDDSTDADDRLLLTQAVGGSTDISTNPYVE